MQIKLPEICCFKICGQKFTALAHMDKPSQEDSDIRIMNPSYGLFLLQGLNNDSPVSENRSKVQGCKLEPRRPRELGYVALQAAVPP